MRRPVGIECISAATSVVKTALSLLRNTCAVCSLNAPEYPYQFDPFLGQP